MEGSGMLGRLSRLAAEHARKGRHEAAVAAWEQLLEHAPDNALVAAGLGAALLHAGRVEDAQHWVAASCQRHPENIELLRVVSQISMRLKNRPAAIGALYAALAIEPNAAPIHADLATVLYLDQSPEASLPHSIAAFEADPCAGHAATLIAALLELDRLEEAFGVIEAASRAGADRGWMLLFLSLALGNAGLREDCLAAARAGAECSPDNAAVRHNLAATLLAQGQFTQEAWDNYEHRAGLLDMKTWPSTHRRWRGEPASGKTVLIHAEQGLGDTLQFVRYVPMVADRGPRVVLAVQKPLVRLLQGTPGADLVVSPGPDVPRFDLYCPLLSLPGVFGTTEATIPPPIPYRVEFGKERSGERVRIGLVWAGNSIFPDDRKRSIKPNLLAPLAEMDGAEFFSLQFGAETLPGPQVIDAMSGVGDFADTAAVVAGLDLVVSVDTSVAHLAATMGKPVWLLSRFGGCWRWMLDRADTPWYPTMRIYRQEAPGDWPSVIARVRADLARLIAERREVTTLAA